MVWPMMVEERQFKATGYVRLGLYTFFFLLCEMLLTLLILPLLPRLMYLFGGPPDLPYLVLALVSLLSALLAFWVVGFLLVVPTATQLTHFGFISKAPYRPNGEINVNFSELGTIFELGFGTWVSAHSPEDNRNYRFIFGKDTEGYYHLIDSLKDGLNEFRAAR